jgi:hypothetical protein
MHDMIIQVHEQEQAGAQLLDRLVDNYSVDIPFILYAAVEAAKEEKAINSDLYGDIMDLQSNPTHHFLLVKKSLMDRIVALASNWKGIIGQNAKIRTFTHAFLAHLLGAQHAVLPSPDKLSHPIFSLMAPFATFNLINIDDAGIRDVRALSDLTMLGCIHGGTNVPQEHEINIFDSSCILQRIPEECRAALRSHLYVYPRRNTTVEFAEILQPLLFEDDVEGPTLANLMDGPMTFVPGSTEVPMAKALSGIASLYSAIEHAKANGRGHSIQFETGDILIMKKQAVLYSKEYIDDSTPVPMGGTDRELVRSYWLSASTFEKMSDSNLFYRG